MMTPGVLTEQRIILYQIPKRGKSADLYRPGGREIKGKGPLPSWPQKLYLPPSVSWMPVTTHIFLGSWMAGSVTAWDQLPWGDTWLTCDCALVAHLGVWAAWPLEVHACLGLWQLPPGPATVSAPHMCQQSLQCPSLSTAQQNKRARISGHFCPLGLGQR